MLRAGPHLLDVEFSGVGVKCFVQPSSPCVLEACKKGSSLKLKQDRGLIGGICC